MLFDVPGCIVLPKRLVSLDSTRSRHPSAGRRLRVELGQTFRFGHMIISGTQKALSDSRRYRAAVLLILTRMRGRGKAAPGERKNSHSFSSGFIGLRARPLPKLSM
jgi:hypothetical protein